MNRLCSTALGIALLLVMNTVVSAAITQTRSSSNFNQKGCEGTLPCPSFVVSTAGFSTDPTNNFFIYDNQQNGHVGWTGTVAVPTFKDVNGWTIESRLRVSQAANTTQVMGQLSAGDDTAGFYGMNLFSNRFGGVFPVSTPSSTTTPHDFTQWTTVRMAKEALTDQVRIWINNIDKGLFNPSNATLVRSWQVVGDGLTQMPGKLEIDYVRSEARGAFAPPVPEPTSILLAAMAIFFGGALSARRRK